MIERHPDGFYWVRIEPDCEWEIGHLIAGDLWICGSDEVIPPDRIHRIGPRVSPPNDDYEGGDTDD